MFIPDPTFFRPRSEFFSYRIHIKELSILTPKNVFLSSRKYDPGCSSRIQGSKRHRIPRSGSATLQIFSSKWSNSSLIAYTSSENFNMREQSSAVPFYTLFANYLVQLAWLKGLGSGSGTIMKSRIGPSQSGPTTLPAAPRFGYPPWC
jgi:hypothetical protein